MTARELARATADLDGDLVVDTFRMPTQDERDAFEAARSARGRAAGGVRVRVVSVSVDTGLLARTDALARRLRLPRAALVERGLRAVLAVAGET
jgi:hypothetical protein